MVTDTLASLPPELKGALWAVFGHFVHILLNPPFRRSYMAYFVAWAGAGYLFGIYSQDLLGRSPEGIWLFAVWGWANTKRFFENVISKRLK